MFPERKSSVIWQWWYESACSFNKQQMSIHISGSKGTIMELEMAFDLKFSPYLHSFSGKDTNTIPTQTLLLTRNKLFRYLRI